MESAKKMHKENSSIETTYIEGTPFAIRGAKDEWYCMWGKFAISPKMNSYEEAEQLIENKDWTILHNMASIIAHSVYNEGLANLTNNIENVLKTKNQ